MIPTAAHGWHTAKQAFLARYRVTAVRKKKTKRKAKSISLKASILKRAQKRGADSNSASVTGMLKILAVIGVFVAVGAGLMFLDKYVKKAASASTPVLDIELVDPPAWFNQPLADKIRAAVTADRRDLKVDENTARSIQASLESGLAWLHNVKVQTAANRILIQADYRKPIALIKLGLQEFYVDAELVVLDFVQMPNLPLVQVKGLLSVTSIPSAGQVWQRDDLAEAVALLVRLDRMDKLVTPDKPLLAEIDRIDVSNFRGREDKRFPHIVLYADDDTEIIWGAEMGTWTQHFEAKDEEKLAKLYNYYKQRGSLLNGAKYINLRDPQSSISLPTDRY